MKTIFSLLLVAIFLLSCKTSSSVVQHTTFTPSTMGWASWNNYHVYISENKGDIGIS